MHPARSAVRLAPVALVVALGLTACSPSGSDSATAVSSSTSTGSARVGAPASLAVSTPAGARPACAQTPTVAIHDGRWTGPITLDVTGHAPGLTAEATGTGGVMTLTVAGGRVTSGTFSYAFAGVGTDVNRGATVSLTVTVANSGTVAGSAGAPVLSGTSTLTGTAKVTSPIQFSTPLDLTGPVSVTLTLTRATCTAVSADFIPSWNQQIDRYYGGAKAVSGREVWTARPA